MSQPKSVQVQVTNVYERNDRSKARYLLNIGGARSSKSHSIAQVLLRRFVNIPRRKIAICRKTFPALRLTAYRLVTDLLSEYGLYSRVLHDKANHVITNPGNGAYIAFLSVDDPEKIKSTEWNDIWMEEASEFTWEDWIVLQTRLSAPTTTEHPNQIFLSLNPSDEEGWVNQRLMLSKHFARLLEVIHSTYRDNPFLDAAYIELLEGLKDQDPNAWRVYAAGKWGALTNVIYVPYDFVQRIPDDVDETIYGLDFGFNNPSALIEIGIKDVRDCYLRELLYETHLTNSDLIEKIKELIPKDKRQRPIYADCAEPDRIREIFNAGFNIHPADKEVKVGIDFCKRKRFYSVADNVNLNKERGSYKWRQDKNGKVLEEPVKFLDHLMDAKRYALYTHFKSMANMGRVTIFEHGKSNGNGEDHPMLSAAQIQEHLRNVAAGQIGGNGNGSED